MQEYFYKNKTYLTILGGEAYGFREQLQDSMSLGILDSMASLCDY